MYNYSNDFLNFKMCVGEFDSLLSDESSDSVKKNGFVVVAVDSCLYV